MLFSMKNICFPFIRFNQYPHNLLQTIDNETRSFSEYKELIQIKEETRNVYIALKVKLCSYYRLLQLFTFIMNLSEFIFYYILLYF